MVVAGSQIANDDMHRPILPAMGLPQKPRSGAPGGDIVDPDIGGTLRDRQIRNQRNNGRACVPKRIKRFRQRGCIQTDNGDPVKLTTRQP